MNTLDEALLAIIKGNLNTSSCNNAKTLLDNGAKITRKNYEIILRKKNVLYGTNKILMLDLVAKYGYKPAINDFIYILNRINCKMLLINIPSETSWIYTEHCENMNNKKRKNDSLVCIELLKSMITNHNIFDNNEITANNRKEILKLSALKLDESLFKLIFEKIKDEINVDDFSVKAVEPNIFQRIIKSIIDRFLYLKMYKHD